MADFVEKDPKDIVDLEELQLQARFNTKAINKVRYELEDANPLTLENLTKELNSRKSRSGSILRKRKELEAVEKKKKEVEEEKKRFASRDNTFSEFEKTKFNIIDQVLELAQKVEQSHRKVNQLEQRGLATKLLALQRGCYAAYESLKRVPSLETKE